MKSDIYLYGMGGLGRETAAMLRYNSEWQLAGFFDDRLPLGIDVDGVRSMGGMQELLKKKEPILLVIAIGDPQVKLSLLGKLQKLSNIKFPVLVHPDCKILDPQSVTIGEGSIITAGVVITTNAIIGSHSLINLNSTIGHDVQIGQGSSLMPGVHVAGAVTIGVGVMVGSGAIILNGLKVEDGATVGAGAVVSKNVQPGVTVVGIPAKPLVK
jgi:sugar O-acyltransferase (sialic acid O-acetyltransferase NeuD family)